MSIKKILFLGGSKQQYSIISLAKKKKYYVIICDANSHCHGKKYADKFKRISEFESDLEFEWLNEENSSKLPNDDLIKKRERWEESLKKDLYITEAVEILKDLSNQIKIGKPIAQHKEK